MTDRIAQTASHHHPDDIVVWPDGSWAHLCDASGCCWKSDDCEVIRLEDTDRLRELGILGELT